MPRCGRLVQIVKSEEPRAPLCCIGVAPPQPAAPRGRRRFTSSFEFVCNNRANSRQAEKAKSVMARRRTTVYAAAMAKSAAMSWLSFCSPQQLTRRAVHIGLSAHMPRRRRRQHLPQQSPAPTRLCSLALVDRRNRWAVAVLQYAVAMQPPPPPQVYGTEFVLGASADEVVGCRELYRRRLAASADRLLFRRRRIAGLDRRAVPSQLFPRATAFLNSSCSLG